jgi:hypothetical protein
MFFSTTPTFQEFSLGLSIFPGVYPEGLFPLWEGKFRWCTLQVGKLILESFLYFLNLGDLNPFFWNPELFFFF